MSKRIEEVDESMGAFWRDVKEARQEKRANNREQSAELLKAAGIRFDTKNMGAHLIVYALGKTFDFWPGTGKWKDRSQSNYQYGVRQLIRACTPMQGT